jgi:hypothetical protein
MEDMTEAAKSDSWKTKPMPAEVAVLDYAAEFSPEEFERISRGLVPQEMEDKWFIFLEGNTLNLHRSWTGHCIYQVEFDRDVEKYSVRRATANRVPDEYRQTDDAYDAQMFHFLISNFLLGRSVPFPVPSDLPKDTPKGVYQHHVSGSGYPETEVAQKPWWKFWK